MSTLAPSTTATAVTTTLEMVHRTGRQLARTPQVPGIAVAQSVIFLLMFRYVFGGAIGVDGVPYVNFLVPGFVVGGMLFTAGGTAVAVATDAATGFNDRLRSMPISGTAVLLGRAVADMALLLGVAVVTAALGFAIGFRPSGSAGGVALSILLLVLYAWAIASVFLWLGLVGGSAQAVQGLGILGVPFSFLSSAFVPVQSMPAVLQVIAEYQPLTLMVDAVRGLVLGEPVTATTAHSLTFSVVGSVLWSIGLLAVFFPLAVRRYRRG
ncbi:ABC transporter DrrB family efflux protein [Nakamurella sp. UYEF19]|uniref:ABC transporter permease n=1 Tax=Nakamurella sp. UYEF19 TaxID=1756392 RepID=UPI0033998A3D